MRFSGAVLAGGQSRRFGQDKARYRFMGKPLAQWVLEGLSPASERFMVANRDYPEFGVPVWPDRFLNGDSLSGLHAALHHAREDWVAVAGCDQPFLNAAFWQFMGTKVSPPYAAVAVWHPQGFFEPLGAFYHKSLEPMVLQRLESRAFKMQSLLEQVETLRVRPEEVAAFGPKLFLNANRLEDL